MKLATAAAVVILVSQAAQRPGGDPPPMLSAEGSLEKTPPAIVLEALPPVVAVGAAVEIRGTSFADPRNPAVQITVVGPGSAATKHALTAKADATGRFSVSFDKTEAAGEYRVEAAGANGLARGRTSFTVTQPAAVITAVDETVVELLNAGRDLVQTLGGRAKSLPPSPPKADVIEKIQQLEKQLEEVFKQVPELRQRGRELGKLASKYPSLRPAMRPLLEEFSKWNLAAGDHVRKARAETARLKVTTVTCDTLQALQDGFEFAAFLWTFAAKPAEILTHWATEWTPPRLVKLAGDAAHAHLPNKEIQIAWPVICCASHHHKLSWQALEKTTFEIMAYLTEKVFGAFCEKFQGPISGSMFIQFLSKDLDVWWEYSIHLTGQLTVRYPKGGAGGPVSGEFQGHATRFHSWDDAISIGWPKLVRGASLFRFAREPFEGAVADAVLGEVHAGDAVKSVLTPAFFKVPVTGHMTDEYMELGLKEAVVDFTDAKAKVVYVIFSPLTLMLPVWTKFDLPYKDARFILDRAMNDGPARFNIVTDRQAKTMTIFREFSRPRDAGPTRAKYFLTVKACNPGCGAAH